MKSCIALTMACLAVGPCVVINPTRNYTVHQNGTGNNEVSTTVDKTESFDGKLESNITGINATATATANINAAKADVKKPTKGEK